MPRPRRLPSLTPAALRAATPLAMPLPPLATTKAQTPLPPPRPRRSSKILFITASFAKEKIEFDAMSIAWTVLTQNMGTCVLFGLALLGISIGGQIVGAIFEIIGSLAVPLGGTVLSNVWAQFVQAFTTCISVLFGLAVMRGNRSPFDVAFNVGPHYARVLGLTFLIVFGFLILFVTCLVPIFIAADAVGEEEAILIGAAVLIPLSLVFIFVSVVTILSNYFIVDRDAGVIDSIKLSFKFMRGNILLVILMMILVFIVGGAASILTCGIGFLVFSSPYLTLLLTTFYLQATGQPIATSAQVRTPPPAQY